MKNISFLLLFISACLQSQNQDINDAKAALKNFYETGSQLNVKKLKQFMTAKYIEINKGQIITGDSLLKNVTESAKTVKAEKAKYSRNNKFKFVNAFVNGNVAWMTYYLRSIEKYNETVEESFAIETVLLEKENGVWKVSQLNSSSTTDQEEEED